MNHYLNGTPSNTPLDRWAHGWLINEVGWYIPGYGRLWDPERKALGMPSTDEERRAFIAEKRRQAEAIRGA